MDEDTVVLVKASFVDVAKHRDEVAELFFERLFVADPGLRRLFSRTDLSIEGARLVATLAQVVKNLQQLDPVRPALQDLAIRLVGQGFQQTHYQTVGEVLVQTLALIFADRFTPELRTAWRSLYQVVSDIMMAAAYPPATEARACGAAHVARA